MITLLIVCGLTFVGFALGFLAVSLAPVGFEDETGFHYGQEHGYAEEHFACHAETRPA